MSRYRINRGGGWEPWVDTTDELEGIEDMVAVEIHEQLTREKARELYPEAFARFEEPNK